MGDSKKYYLTTSIAYANSEPHIGFLFEMLSADILARSAKLLGQEVFFLTGTDEHGAKIAKKAAEVEIEPQDFVSSISKKFELLGQDFDIGFDYFLRTTNNKHKEFVQRQWQKLLENGFLEKRTYLGHYCVGCEAFKTQRELIDERCPIHKSKVERIEEENWFFTLSKFQENIVKWLETNSPRPISPESRLNEVKEFVRGGLEDISFSRHRSKLNWGIPVPNDPDQVMYVWADALLNYLSALEIDGKESFWPAQLQIVGKDITRFHAIIWPALLTALGYELPEKILVHGFILSDGEKMSKSLGNVITPSALRERYGKDGARYLLFRMLNFYDDSNFVWSEADSLYNGELANGLGNLVARSVTLLSTFQDVLGGELIRAAIEKAQSSAPAEARKVLAKRLITDHDFGSFISLLNSEIKKYDLYITESKPWEWRKNGQLNQERVTEFVQNVKLFYLVELLRPIIPSTAEKILAQLASLKSVPLFPRLG